VSEPIHAVEVDLGFCNKMVSPCVKLLVPLLGTYKPFYVIAEVTYVVAIKVHILARTRKLFNSLEKIRRINFFTP
jgi:hypothetical protein